VYEALAAVTMPSSTSHSDSHADAENDNQEDLNNDYDDDENDFEGGEEEKDESAAIQVDQQQIGRAVKEKRQIFLLLHSLSSGIAVAKSETPNDDYYRVPLVITAFAVQALQIIARPEGELYPLINRFLLQRPFINMNDIPMLYDLFNCTDDRMARRCRTLIVRIILGSLQTGRRRSSTEVFIIR
jgi:hypothetical protein